MNFSGICCSSGENISWCEPERHDQIKQGVAIGMVAVAVIAIVVTVLMVLSQQGYDISGINAIARSLAPGWVYAGLVVSSLLFAAGIIYGVDSLCKPEEDIHFIAKEDEPHLEMYVKIAGKSLYEEQSPIPNDRKPVLLTFVHADAETVSLVTYDNGQVHREVISKLMLDTKLYEKQRTHHYVTPEQMAKRPLQKNEQTHLLRKKHSAGTKAAIRQHVRVLSESQGMQEKQFAIVSITGLYAAITIRHEDKEGEAHYDGAYSRLKSHKFKDKVQELEKAGYIDVSPKKSLPPKA